MLIKLLLLLSLSSHRVGVGSENKTATEKDQITYNTKQGCTYVAKMSKYQT